MDATERLTKKRQRAEDGIMYIYGELETVIARLDRTWWLGDCTGAVEAVRQLAQQLAATAAEWAASAATHPADVE